MAPAHGPLWACEQGVEAGTSNMLSPSCCRRAVTRKTPHRPGSREQSWPPDHHAPLPHPALNLGGFGPSHHVQTTRLPLKALCTSHSLQAVSYLPALGVSFGLHAKSWALPLLGQEHSFRVSLCLRRLPSPIPRPNPACPSRLSSRTTSSTKLPLNAHSSRHLLVMNSTVCTVMPLLDCTRRAPFWENKDSRTFRSMNRHSSWWAPKSRFFLKLTLPSDL